MPPSKSVQISVRFEQTTFDAIVREAERDGLTPTEWLRTLATRAVSTAEISPIDAHILERIEALSILVERRLCTDGERQAPAIEPKDLAVIRVLNFRSQLNAQAQKRLDDDASDSAVERMQSTPNGAPEGA